MKMTKYWPLVVAFVFFALLIGAYLFYAPSWGLMDDSQNLDRAQAVWQSGNILRGLWDVITSGVRGWGIFWPVYCTWAIFIYHIFKDSPLSIYILIACFNFISLFLWGVVLHKIFSAPKDDFLRNVFLFPLIFFIFTPFWNIFMYISVQQKFVIFFSALSFYFLAKAYNSGRNKYLIFSFLALLASIFSHPEGIYLSMAYIVFSILDITLLKYKKKVSIANFTINSIFFFLYYIFTVKVQMLGGYTAKYKNNLNMASLLNMFVETPMIVKAFFAGALVAFVCMLVQALRKKNNFLPLAIIIPIGIMTYLGTLLPWGFPNYHISLLAPHLFGLIFPVYLWLCRRKYLSLAVNGILIPISVTMVFFYVGFPRIQKMAEIKHMESFIKVLAAKNPHSFYFLPPPCVEATGAIKYFTGVDAKYLFEGKLSKELLSGRYQNYLVIRDECSMVTLDNVKAEEDVYGSNTWRIVRVSSKNDYSAAYKADFKENTFRKVITYLKRF